MKYLKESFSVAVGSKEYRDNWDAVFGKKCPECGGVGVHKQIPLEEGSLSSGPCPRTEGGRFDKMKVEEK